MLFLMLFLLDDVSQVVSMTCNVNIATVYAAAYLEFHNIA